MNDPATTQSAEAAAAPDPSPSSGESASGFPSDSGNTAESQPGESSTPAESSSPTGTASSPSGTSSASELKHVPNDTNAQLRADLEKLHFNVGKMLGEQSARIEDLAQRVKAFEAAPPAAGYKIGDVPGDMAAIDRAIKGLAAGIKAVDQAFDLETSCHKVATAEAEPATEQSQL